MSFVLRQGIYFYFVLLSCLPAAERTVLNLNDSGAGSLREAISVADPGDVIVFSPNILGDEIRLQNPLFLAKDLTIDAGGRQSPVILRVVSTVSRALTVGGEVGAKLKLF